MQPKSLSAEITSKSKKMTQNQEPTFFSQIPYSNVRQINYLTDLEQKKENIDFPIFQFEKDFGEEAIINQYNMLANTMYKKIMQNGYLQQRKAPSKKKKKTKNPFEYDYEDEFINDEQAFSVKKKHQVELQNFKCLNCGIQQFYNSELYKSNLSQIQQQSKKRTNDVMMDPQELEIMKKKIRQNISITHNLMKQENQVQKVGSNMENPNSQVDQLQPKTQVDQLQPKTQVDHTLANKQINHTLRMTQVNQLQPKTQVVQEELRTLNQGLMKKQPEIESELQMQNVPQNNKIQEEIVQVERVDEQKQKNKRAKPAPKTKPINKPSKIDKSVKQVQEVPENSQLKIPVKDFQEPQINENQAKNANHTNQLIPQVNQLIPDVNQSIPEISSGLLLQQNHQIQIGTKAQKIVNQQPEQRSLQIFIQRNVQGSQEGIMKDSKQQ